MIAALLFDARCKQSKPLTFNQPVSPHADVRSCTRSAAWQLPVPTLRVEMNLSVGNSSIEHGAEVRQAPRCVDLVTRTGRRDEAWWAIIRDAWWSISPFPAPPQTELV
eukprot:COSAG02_NODE_68_length_42582_cov_52.351129_5_plen_108_part_00